MYYTRTLMLEQARATSARKPSASTQGQTNQERDTTIIIATPAKNESTLSKVAKGLALGAGAGAGAVAIAKGVNDLDIAKGAFKLGEFYGRHFDHD